MQGYCVKCRAKKEMKDPQSVTMKNKTPATQGVCPTCGSKMFRIGIPPVIELASPQIPRLAAQPPVPRLAP